MVAAPERRARIASSRRRVVAGVVTLLALAAIIGFSRPAAIISVLAGIGWSGTAIILALYTVSQLLRTTRIWVALPAAQRATFQHIAAIVSIHQCLNHLLPLRLGEASFPILMKRYAGVPAAAAISVLLVVRLQELVALAFFCSAAAVIRISGATNELSAGWLLGFPAVGFVLLMITFQAMPEALRIGSSVLRHARVWPSLQPLKGRLAGVIERLPQEWLAPVSRGRRVVGWLLTAAIWFNTSLIFLVGLRLSGWHISFVDTVLGSTAASLSHVLPINAFGSFGSLEAGWTLGFAALGFDARSMLAVGFVLHVLLTIFLVLVAVIAWLWLLSGSPQTADNGEVAEKASSMERLLASDSRVTRVEP